MGSSRGGVNEGVTEAGGVNNATAGTPTGTVTLKVNGEEVPWPDNPLGRGYCEAPEEALGKALPNIQSIATPANPRWDARPPVAADDGAAAPAKQGGQVLRR